MWLIITVLILLFFAIICILVENNCILIKRREDFDGDTKILHISDCHKRNNADFNKRVIAAAKDEKPDVIFITGDVVSRTETEFSATEVLLTELCDIAPVYMCMGNHEQSLKNDNQRKLLDVVAKTDVRLLVNDGEYAEINGKKYAKVMFVMNKELTNYNMQYKMLIFHCLIFTTFLQYSSLAF